VPFPKASLAVLQVFATMSNIEIDFTELAEQATTIEKQLGQLLAQVEERMGGGMPEAEEYGLESTEEGAVSAEDARRIDRLFEQATHDRSKAYELKRELDRMGVFASYEDRFLDLFRKPE
jgi:hypothetical protein